MSPFWSSFLGDLRERGRHPTIFIVALAALGGLILVGAMLKEALTKSTFDKYGGMALLCVGILALVWFAVAIYRAFFRKTEQSKLSRLSSDELTKARSKLVKNRNRTSL